MENKDKMITIRATAVTLTALDTLRKLEIDLPSRGEMLRRLIARAMVKADEVE